ncbi:MAG: class I SAM-dependent methyltransferase [Verrucomicrobia bacterium]|nr:class I SAM-dependent methyltransferase [Verrucomicrobiota bacterium]MBT7068569.1 class I SAM-dependent methyltransferase [Verrucomicrobiota bacterium]MBT7699563.1 class I SAM-dependent methyltransferase [Verrucomicrobiota bacterium]
MKTHAQATEYFEARFTPDPGRAGVWREIARYVERDLADPSSLLELGCGYGDFIRQVRAHKRLALDLNGDARQWLPEEVSFRQGDCTDLSYLPDRSVANVFASNLLEHLTHEQLDRLMPEIKRILAPSGRLLLIQPNYRLCAATYFDDYTHVTVFSDVGLSGLLAAHGLRVRKCIPGLLPFSMKSTLPKYPWLVRLYLRSPIRPLARQMYLVAESE